MADAKIEAPFQRAKSGEVREALDRLEGLVVDQSRPISHRAASICRHPTRFASMPV
jgi:hypothetical protein